MRTFETEKQNIPEGATHYSDESCEKHFSWFKFDGKEWFIMIWYDDDWVKCEHNEQETSGAKPIPQTKEVEWENGLPPVGEECEFQYPQGRWNKGYYHGLTRSKCLKMHIVEYEGGSIESLGDLVSFRKPESPEAKKEREELEGAYDIYLHVCKDSNRGYLTFGQFLDESLTSYKNDYLAIVHKTGYRVEK